MKKNQNGFSVIEGLLILVIAGLVGFVGWYVWHSKNNADSIYNSAAGTTSGAKTGVKAKSKSLTTDVTSQNNYFVIKEWNVRAPYSGSLTLEYYVSSDGTAAGFTSKQLTDADSDAGCGIGTTQETPTFTVQNHGGGYIGRYLPSDDIPTEGPPAKTAQEFLSQDFAASNSQPPSYSKVGAYYYIYWHEQGPCGPSTDLQEQTETAVALIAKSLQAN